MAVRKQLGVLIANRPSTLAALASTLAREKVNIEALATMDATDYTLVRLVPDDADKAAEALKRICLITDLAFFRALLSTSLSPPCET